MWKKRGGRVGERRTHKVAKVWLQSGLASSPFAGSAHLASPGLTSSFTLMKDPFRPGVLIGTRPPVSWHLTTYSKSSHNWLLLSQIGLCVVRCSLEYCLAHCLAQNAGSTHGVFTVYQGCKFHRPFLMQPEAEGVHFP